MTKTHRVYLAGPIQGLSYAEAQEWRNALKVIMDPRVALYSPLRAKSYLLPCGVLTHGDQATGEPLSTPKALTDRDRLDCLKADLVICNLLKAKSVSIGTMIELGWADSARIPIVLVMEESGNVHDHTMVREICSYRTENLREAVNVAMAVLLPDPARV